MTVGHIQGNVHTIPTLAVISGRQDVLIALTYRHTRIHPLMVAGKTINIKKGALQI